ncbi:MAG: hypothetical protein RI897_832 [Verrucomicrobiota bacterium]|jgi:hypothetical protein
MLTRGDLAVVIQPVVQHNEALGKALNHPIHTALRFTLTVDLPILSPSPAVLWTMADKQPSSLPALRSALSPQPSALGAWRFPLRPETGHCTAKLPLAGCAPWCIEEIYHPCKRYGPLAANWQSHSSC